MVAMRERSVKHYYRHQGRYQQYSLRRAAEIRDSRAHGMAS